MVSRPLVLVLDKPRRKEYGKTSKLDSEGAPQGAISEANPSHFVQTSLRVFLRRSKTWDNNLSG